jgi:hypothetical protein
MHGDRRDLGRKSPEFRLWLQALPEFVPAFTNPLQAVAAADTSILGFLRHNSPHLASDLKERHNIWW